MTRIKNNIRLLSIHIPKTAGSSFQKSLEAVYGKDQFMRLDFSVQQSGMEGRLAAKNQTKQSSLDDLVLKKSLDPAISVLHGHIHYADFASAFEIHPDLKVITWLRDPFERIVSNYNYLLSVLDNEISHTKKSKKIFGRMVKSMAEFAQTPRDVNMYSDYLAGKKLDDYTFIGLVEQYDADLAYLGNLLSWKKIPSFHINKTAKKSLFPSEEEEQEIRKWCAANFSIYEEAVRLGKKRVS